MTAAAKALRALHVPGSPLVVPNAWDVSSARVFAEAGHPVVATTSVAVAAALGMADGHAMPADVAFDAVRRIADAVDVPVTTDIERGYDLPPARIAERLAQAGAAGCNLEDSDPRTKAMVDVGEQAAFLGAVRAADADLVINARIDEFIHGDNSFDDAVRRARAYFEAGADCVYPIRLPGDRIAEFVEAVGGRPVNIAHGPGAPAPKDLGPLGVARVSFGPGLHNVLMKQLAKTAADMLDGSSPYRG
ncbi:2-methylisocitrate lyase-like PEP mutase family enzyme [Saccharothrix carnea]|uniref:2-methylisocitrate lyase-like PEP mutase family enzyme n=1 Tax=Saccharothrix carnea TaxID=1280637 RepID=A0A2P8IGJ2_SACCR|nr:2-methylisocitrate lyase-like PEP mutase family enzyme [Saccharothrix carnea]